MNSYILLVTRNTGFSFVLLFLFLFFFRFVKKRKLNFLFCAEVGGRVDELASIAEAEQPQHSVLICFVIYLFGGERKIMFSYLS